MQIEGGLKGIYYYEKFAAIQRLVELWIAANFYVSLFLLSYQVLRFITSYR